MTDYREQIDRLLVDSEGLEDGHTKVGLLEEAVRIADTHADVGLGFELRKELLGAALGAGHADQLLVAYSWCLAQVDKDPRKYHTSDLLWEYRWVLSELTAFPQIGREQIESMYEDMIQRYRQAGASMRSVYLLRRVVAIDMGDRPTAVEMNKAWKRSARDHYSDSYLTELAFQLRYLCFVGKEHLALEQAGQFFRGNLWSEHHEGTCLAMMLMPLVKRGRAEEAIDYFQRGYRLLSKNPRYVEEFGDFIVFLVLTDNLARAATLFTKHLPSAIDNCNAMCRFFFYRASTFLMNRLQQSGKTTVKLRLPSNFLVSSTNGRHALSDLETWFRERTIDLAQRFDRRNGNDYYMKLWAELKKWPKFISPCSLK